MVKNSQHQAMVKTFENKKVVLKAGDKFVFTTEDIVGNEERVSVNYKHLTSDLKADDIIMLNNGLVHFRVEEIRGNEVITTVLVGGEVSDRKSMNFPNKVLAHDYLSEQDKKDLIFGIENGVDFIAASFVSCKNDVKALREFLNGNGGREIDIIAKIENRAGVDNIDEICEVADGIMVARGDLGVEISFEKIPAIQKRLIDACNSKGKIVITATQMLESMTQNPRPTRAEVSDVANAIYDGTTAIMLSGESAAGQYPIEAVKTMSKIALTAEADIDYYNAFERDHTLMEPNVINAVCASAYSAAEYLDAAAIIVMTRSGRTAKTLASFHPPCPIIAVTMEDKGVHQLKLTWNVTPIESSELDSPDALLEYALEKARASRIVRKGDKVIALLASDLHCDNNIMRICIV